MSLPTFGVQVIPKFPISQVFGTWTLWRNGLNTLNMVRGSRAFGVKDFGFRAEVLWRLGTAPLYYLLKVFPCISLE